MDIIEKHLQAMKVERPAEYKELAAGYRTEKDLLWECRHYAAKTNKMLKGKILK